MLVLNVICQELVNNDLIVDTVWLNRITHGKLCAWTITAD